MSERDSQTEMIDDPLLRQIAEEVDDDLMRRLATAFDEATQQQSTDYAQVVLGEAIATLQEEIDAAR